MRIRAVGTALIALFLSPGMLTPRCALYSAQDSTLLAAGSGLRREISAGQVQEYPVAVSSGTFLRFILDQSKDSMVATLLDPAGGTILEKEVDEGDYNPVLLSHTAESTGIYRLAVRLAKVSPIENPARKGSYAVELAELEPATEQHRNRLRAERLLEEANRRSDSEDGIRDALERMREAIELCQGDYPLLLIAHMQAAGACMALGDLDGLVAALTERRALARAHGEPLREADSLVYMSYCARVRGGLQVALDSALQAMELYQATGGWNEKINGLLAVAYAHQFLKDHARAAEEFYKASSFNPLGNGMVFLSYAAGQYYLDGQLEKAIQCYETAAQNAAIAGSRQDFQTECLLRAALIYAELGQHQKTLGNVDRVRSLWQSQDAPPPRPLALSLLGSIYSREGDKPAAIECLDRAVTLITQKNQGMGEFGAIGETYRQLGAAQKARACFDEWLKFARSTRRPGVLNNALALIARDERDQGNLLAARGYMEQALDGIEAMRGMIASPELSSVWLAGNQKYYEFYIDLLMRLAAEIPAAGYQEAAFQASERARARSLLESLSETEVDIRQGVDSGLLDHERALNVRINATADKLRLLLRQPKHTPEQVQDLERQLDRLTAELAEVGSRIRSSSPHYAAMTRPVPLSLAEIQQNVLDRDTVLLEYALGEERSFLWAVTRNAMSSFTLPPRAEIEAAARRVYELLTERNRMKGADWRNGLAKARGEYPAAAERLSKLVLGPAASLLGTRRLLIVTQGVLQYIPFAALPEPRPAPSPGRKSSWLIESHEIVYLPSASVLIPLRRETAARKPAPGELAVLADPVFDADDPRVTETAAAARPAGRGTGAFATSLPPSALSRALGDADPDRGARLPRLLLSRREAEAVSAAVPKGAGLKALDFNASRSAAISPGLSGYRIVHFATHGLVDSRNPSLSGIVLSLVDKRGRQQDGFLRLHDIYNLRLPADLVVLSACRTALGKEVQGEGLVGLTRGFMYAGAARVAASLWNVDDTATAELMGRFYRNMFGGRRPPAAALRAAQIELSRQQRWQDPYYWASFQLQGEWK